MSPPLPSLRACTASDTNDTVAGALAAPIHGREGDRLRNHRRGCAHYSQRTPQHDPRVTPRKRQSETTHATPSPAKRPNCAPCPWTKTRLDALNRATVRMQATLGLPDTFVTNPEFLEFIKFFESGCSGKLMSTHKLRNFVDEYADEIYRDGIRSLKEHQAYTRGRVNLLSDGWGNPAKLRRLGFQLSLYGQVVMLSFDEVGTSHDGVAVAKQLEAVIVKAQADGWNLGAVTTDGAGQCARARRILTLRWPSIAFGKCFAHDINNLVKVVLNTSFKTIAIEAAKVVNTLIASSAKWLPRAQAEMERMCGVKLALYTVCDPRWNSMQACFASLLRVKTALGNFYAQYAADADYPALFVVFGDDDFWMKLRDAERVIHPLAEASYKLQRDNSTLSDVVEMYQKIYIGFTENVRYGTELVGCIEKRWRSIEQPLLLTAFFLHPKRAGCNKKFHYSLIERVSYFVFYYFRKFVDSEPGFIRHEFSLHVNGMLTRTDASHYPDVFTYWKQVSDEQGKKCMLAKLALVVLSFGANTAPCERTFSDPDIVHTPVRNRVSYMKSLPFHRIRQHIFARRKKNDSEPQPVPNRIVDPGDRRTLSGGSSEEQVCDDPGSVEDTFTFWEGVLDEYCGDGEVEEDLSRANRVEVLDPNEVIESVDRATVELPEIDDDSISLDEMTGLRSWRISLQELCQAQRRENELTSIVA